MCIFLVCINKKREHEITLSIIINWEFGNKKNENKEEEEERKVAATTERKTDYAQKFVYEKYSNPDWKASDIAQHKHRLHHRYSFTNVHQQMPIKPKYMLECSFLHLVPNPSAYPNYFIVDVWNFITQMWYEAKKRERKHTTWIAISFQNRKSNNNNNTLNKWNESFFYQLHQQIGTAIFNLLQISNNFECPKIMTCKNIKSKFTSNVFYRRTYFIWNNTPHRSRDTPFKYCLHSRQYTVKRWTHAWNLYTLLGFTTAGLIIR